MGVTRADFTRSGKDLEMSDAEWEAELATRKTVVNAYSYNDKWAVKIKKKVAVLLTAWTGGLPFLKASLESHQKLGFWTVLAYDNFIAEYECPCPNRFQKETLNEREVDINYNRFMPPKDVMNLVDTFLLPHHQCWGGVSYPYVWLIRLASGILQEFDYVLLNNGDMVLEKPEGFPTLLAKMGDADLMSSGPSLPNELGTAGLLIKSSALIKMAKHMSDHMVPFEEYEKSTQNFGNTEGRTRVAVRELGLTEVVCKPGSCPSHTVCEQLHTPGGEWFDILGMRHVHGELNYAHRYGKQIFQKTGKILVPPPSKYLDQRLCGGEDYKAAVAYESGDLEFVKNWWAKD